MSAADERIAVKGDPPDAPDLGVTGEESGDEILLEFVDGLIDGCICLLLFNYLLYINNY